jgi:hypothetical protein
MPVLKATPATQSPTIQQIVTQMRANPKFIPVLGTIGYTQEPALSISNDLMQRILSEGMNWKWNRGYVPAILTVALQQDYCTQVTDIGWLETAWRVDINNSTNNGNLAPKPVFPMEAVRDLDQTAMQRVPFQVSFIPNTIAFLGQWYANTEYGCGYGVSQIPISPIQQFLDINGNILYIDSTVLGLNINSPGFTSTPIVLPTPNPYGVSGSVQPSAPPDSPAGTQITDGTVTWTVADPNGYAIRVAPLPAFSGLAWLITPVYQSKPPYFTDLHQTISPLPPEYTYLFRQGFRAKLYAEAGDKQATEAYAKWEEDLIVAVKGADRQQEECVVYPSESLMGNNSNGMPIGLGAAWPFGPSF